MLHAQHLGTARPVEADVPGALQAPTFVLDGEPFFGEDRIDTLRWHLSKIGLQRG